MLCNQNLKTISTGKILIERIKLFYLCEILTKEQSFRNCLERKVFGSSFVWAQRRLCDNHMNEQAVMSKPSLDNWTFHLLVLNQSSACASRRVLMVLPSFSSLVLACSPDFSPVALDCCFPNLLLRHNLYRFAISTQRSLYQTHQNVIELSPENRYPCSTTRKVKLNESFSRTLSNGQSSLTLWREMKKGPQEAKPAGQHCDAFSICLLRQGILESSKPSTAFKSSLMLLR